MPKKDVMMSHKVSLTPTQAKRLLKGQATLLKHEQMEGGDVEIHMSAKKHRRLMRNMSKKKGYKLSLSPEELDGGGLKDWMQKAGTFIKDKIVKPYQSVVKPVVGPMIRKSLAKALPAAAGAAATMLGQPELAAPAAALASKIAAPLVNKIGDVTHAYGLGGAGVEKHHHRLESNSSNFLNPSHPAMHPILPPHDMSYGAYERHGGSFKVMGEGMHHHRHRLHHSMEYGNPMHPRLPQGDMSMIRL